MMHGHPNVKFAMSEVKDTRSAAQNAKKSIGVGVHRFMSSFMAEICRDIQATRCAWWRGKMKTL